MATSVPNAHEKEKQDAMDLAESSREEKWTHPSFVGELFNGRFRADLITPYLDQPADDKKIGDDYNEMFGKFLLENADADELDRTGELPKELIDGLIRIGALGLKIDKKYGGQGLSQTNYNRALELLGGHCGNLATLLSAHQSIGAPQPLKLFGTEEQKKTFLPRLTKEVSAFALTEPSVGSDPAKMKTTATLSEDGNHWILNGIKLWCTNGTIAKLIVVMARTPDKDVNGKKRKQISAFLVDTDTPGLKITHRCQFMGFRAIQNGVIALDNVKIPKDNLIGDLGGGLKLALTTLNTGRLSLPSLCIGLCKKCLEIVRHWSKDRIQWGAPLGKHEEIAAKISRMATSIFAMDAITYWTTQLVDRGGADIRLEAAIAKLFCTEEGYRIAYDTVQIRGGRGYETADSLKNRGEPAIPVERYLRDIRILTIFEGSTEIMHLFTAREALDTHMKLAKDLLTPGTSLSKKLKALWGMTKFYTFWYPKQWFYWSCYPKFKEMDKSLAGHYRFLDRTSHKLARTIFHQMIRHRHKLEYRQMVLARIVEVGSEMFAMAASCSKAQHMIKKNPADRTPITLADLFCKDARKRIKRYFKDICCNTDVKKGKLSRDLMAGKYTWLEKGPLQDNLDFGNPADIQ